MQCKTKGSCKGAAKIRGNSAQTQNIGKGGKGTLSNNGKRRKRSPDDDDDDDDDYSFMPDTIDVQEQHVKKGGHGKIKNVHHKGVKNTGPIQKIGSQTQHVSKGAHGHIHNKLVHHKRGKRSPNFIGAHKTGCCAVGSSVVFYMAKSRSECKRSASNASAYIHCMNKKMPGFSNHLPRFLAHLIESFYQPKARS